MGKPAEHLTSRRALTKPERRRFEMAETSLRQKRRYPKRGEPMRYLLAHMWDDCPKWPFARGRGGYGHIQHDGKVRDVHRLVCEMAHGPAPSPNHDAAHECGKGAEGCFGASCIVWKTKSDNQIDRRQHGTSPRGEGCPTSKLSEADVRAIRALRGQETQREIAARYGINRVTVSDIHCRRRWAWLE
jgi:hypothetical protein